MLVYITPDKTLYSLLRVFSYIKENIKRQITHMQLFKENKFNYN